MKQQKPNKTHWYLLGLAVLMTVGLLLGSAGITFARYRTESKASFSFIPRSPDPVCLGILSEPDEEGTVSFVPSGAVGWVTDNNQSRLEFAVANGNSVTNFPEEDLRVQIRLIGSLGLWNGEAPMTIRLSVPNEKDPAVMDEVVATPERILPESPLYDTFGEGWTFTFRDGAGKELFWTLEGGVHSFMSVVLTQEGTHFTDTSLLQLQVSAETIRK